MATIKTTIKRRNGTGWDELRPKTEVDQITDFDANVPDNLDDLTNVNAPSPSDGQALVWDNATSKWVPGTVTTDISGKVDVAGDTMTGDLIIEDSVLKVGDVSGDDYLQIEQIGDGLGFTFQYNNASSIQNLQGSTNQALVLGDVSNGNSGTLLGVSILPSSGSWTKKLNLTGAGELYVGSGATSQVWHHDIFEPIVDNLDVLPTYGASDEDFIKYNTTERAIEVQSSTDSDFGAVYPAIKTESGVSWKISFSIKASASASSGVYFRVQEYDGALPDGKTHISHGASHSAVQEDTRQVTSFYENQGIGTSWEQHSFFYTPTSTTSWFSPLFLNWTGLGTNSLFIKNLRIFAIQEDSADANTLDGYDSSQFLRSDANDTYTGTLTLANDSYISMPAGNAEGIKFGDVVMTYVGTSYDDLTIRNLKQLRFGNTNDWDWNKWAGIGYDAANTKLYIGGPASSYFQSNTSPSNIDVVFDGVDNVGIGTTSPSYKLDVSGTARISSTVKMLAGTSYNENLRMSASTNDYSSIAFGADSSTDTGTQTGQWTLVRYPATTHNNKFSLRHSSNDVMTLLTSGNVGIGTGSPSDTLHIEGNQIISKATSGGQNQIQFKEVSTTKTQITSNYGDNKFYLYHEGDNRMVIDSSGQIGIGTTSPSEKLHIAGDVQIDGSGSTIGGSTLANGWLKIGTSLSMDNNEIYFGTQGYIGTIGANNLLFMHNSSEKAKVVSGGFDVTGNITVSGTVDSVDIAAFKTAYDSHSHSQYAPLASPALTGTPTAPTASSNTNNTQIATTAFVSNKIAGIAGGLNFKGTVSLATSKTGDDLYGTGSGQISSTGDYLIVSSAGDITNSGNILVTLAVQSPGDESDSTLPVTLEVGDWIMYESFSSQTLTVILLNNNDGTKASAVHTHSNYITSNAADTATGKITFTGDIAIDDTDDHAYRIGKDSYDTNMTGISIRPDDEVNPASGDILFTVRSGGGSPRFFVEHAGRIGSTNSDFYLGTGSDTSGGNRVFHDGYHPNADKWTTARTLSLTGDVTGSVSWDGSANASMTTTVVNDSHNHDHSDGNFTVNGDLYGKSVNGQYSNIYRIGGLYFTWDSDTYGTNTNHSIRSTYGDSYGDHITLNSYGHIRMNIDSNNNGTNYFEVGGHTTGTSNTYFQISDTGTTIFPGLSLGISNTNADPGTGTYFRGNSTHFVLGLDSGNTLYLNYGNSAGNFRTYGTHYHNDNAVGTPWGSSNDGSGSGLDADTLDGIDSTSFLRSDADDTMTGDLLLSNAALSYQGQNGVAVPIPQGGLFATTSSTQTGYLKITLPVSWTSTMLSFFVDIYEYTADESFTLQLAGYNYSSSSQWINTTANLVSSSTNRVFNVRFGHDGSKCAIYIGESTSTWSYMQVRVRDFLGGYSNANPSNWADGWAVGFTTTLGTITSTQSLESEVTNADTADKWTTARTITLGGDLSGSVSLDGSANVTLTAAVADDSHNHTIANIDNLQTTLNAKQDSFGDVSTTILPTNGQVLKWNASASEWQPGDDNNTDTNTTYSAGSGLSLSGTTFSHSDTSSQASVNNSGTTFIQDITLDTYGHITGLASHTLTNNVSGSTFQNAYAAPGGGTNTGVLLYGDYYGWHTRSIGSQGQVLRVGSLGTPVWEDGTWTLINSGLDSVYSSGTTDKTVTTGEAIEGAIYAVEIVLSSTAGYTRQILQFTLGGTSTSSFSSIGTVLYSTTSYNRPLAVKVRRQDGNTIEFGYGYSVALDSTPSFAADFIYIGRIWKIGDYDY